MAAPAARVRAAPQGRWAALRASLALLAASALCGCALAPFHERMAHAERLLREQQWVGARAADTASVPGLFVARPRSISPADGTLWIYLEGDGVAWIAGSVPATDPSPADPIALRLALAQPEGAAAYIARPCQFVDAASQPACDATLWTGRRFAAEAVEAVDAAIDSLKAEAAAERIVLVGYSGGGAIAALVAARRNDVRGLVTVAGNLDLARWTALHRLRPMDGSLDPARQAQALARLPQVHWIGADDRIVPPVIAQSYVARGATDEGSLGIVRGFDHACCWVADWSARWAESARRLGVRPGPREPPFSPSPSSVSSPPFRTISSSAQTACDCGTRRV